MDLNEIIEMAKQIGLYGLKEGGLLPEFTAFAKLVAAKEREACAVVAQKTVCDTHIPTGVRIYGTAAAKAIRARGET